MRNSMIISAPPLIISMALLFEMITILTTNVTSTPQFPAAGFTKIDVTSHGAIPDGKTDSSEAFLSAWESACGSVGPSTIVIPRGLFLVKTAVKFSGKKCKSSGVTFHIKGTIVGPSDFEVLGNSKTWFHFDRVTGVTLSGGSFDAKGATLWSCKKSGNSSCPPGATTLRFTLSMNIMINGVTSINSQLYHIVINECKNVMVQDIKVSASGSSPNTDGIHVESSMGVTILNSTIGTGDDCVSIGHGTTNLWIQHMNCGPGHGVSIGSLGKIVNEAGVQNITVKNVIFTKSTNGVRIKSWGKPSSAFAKNILFEHITMVHTQNPIVIDQNYCNGRKGCPPKVRSMINVPSPIRQASGVQITNVTYRGIHGSSATPVGVKFSCSREHPCKNLKLEDINLTYKNQVARSFSSNVVELAHDVIDPKFATNSR